MTVVYKDYNQAFAKGAPALLRFSGRLTMCDLYKYCGRYYWTWSPFGMNLADLCIKIKLHVKERAKVVSGHTTEGSLSTFPKPCQSLDRYIHQLKTGYPRLPCCLCEGTWESHMAGESSFPKMTDSM
jgi:hypothetical protein